VRGLQVVFKLGEESRDRLVRQDERHGSWPMPLSFHRFVQPLLKMVISSCPGELTSHFSSLEVRGLQVVFKLGEESRDRLVRQDERHGGGSAVSWGTPEGQAFVDVLADAKKKSTTPVGKANSKEHQISASSASCLSRAARSCFESCVATGFLRASDSRSSPEGQAFVDVLADAKKKSTTPVGKANSKEHQIALERISASSASCLSRAARSCFESCVATGFLRASDSHRTRTAPSRVPAGALPGRVASRACSRVPREHD
jgi:hypothetical protein